MAMCCNKQRFPIALAFAIAQRLHSVLLAFIHHDGAIVTRPLRGSDCPELILFGPQRRIELLFATVTTWNHFPAHDVWILMRILPVVSVVSIAESPVIIVIVKTFPFELTLDLVPPRWKVAIVATMVLM